MKFGAIVIGRNEGERLRRCLGSLSKVAAVVYVDSGSTDGSVQWARDRGVEVVELDLSRPFTASRARNAGFARLQEGGSDLRYVQFIDGDCQLAEDWPQAAIAFLETQREVAAVFGRRRERYPDRSVYNWMCDHEWNVPVGRSRACGGDVMMRRDALIMVGGYREDMIAGEEPELCVRLRAAGWQIWRIDAEMTLHDAAITRLSQWWRRTLRSGYAFAQGAWLHGAAPERLWVWESFRAWFWGVGLPLACLGAGLVLGPWGWMTWLVYPLQIVRQAGHNPGQVRERLILATFQLLARFPESWGQMRFVWDRLGGRNSRIIEYK